MAKTLCDWSKRDLEKHGDELARIVRDPRFYCRKCARVAHSSKVLCKPRKLPPVDEVDLSAVKKNSDTGD